MILARLTRWAVYLGYAAVAASYMVWTISDQLGDLGGDSAIYLLSAQYLSPWSENTEAAKFFAERSLYPPLFPLTLSLFGAGQNLVTAHVVTTTALLCAFAVCIFWQMRLGFSLELAGAVTLVVALSSGVYFEALYIHSESLFLLLVLSSLYSMRTAEMDGKDTWNYVAALCVAGATLVRSAGVALLAAYILHLLFRRPRGSLRLVALSAIPLLLWSTTQRGGGNYMTAFLTKFDHIGYDGLLEFIGNQARAILQAWYVLPAPTWISAPVMAVVGIAATAGIIVRMRDGNPDALFAVLYLGMLLIWPFPAEMQRFLVVIEPVLLVQAIAFFQTVAARVEARVLKGVAWGLITAVLVVEVPSAILAAERFFTPLPADLKGFRHWAEWYEGDRSGALENVRITKALVDHLGQIEKIVPTGECVYGIKPSVIGFFARRTSVVPPPIDTDDNAFQAYLSANPCQYVYAVGFLSPSYPVAYYPLARMRNSVVVRDTAAVQGRERPAAIIAERVL